MAIAIIYAAVVFVLTQSYRLYNRTVSERQFHPNSEWWEHDLGTIRKFEARHGLNPETHNGLRLAIDEWPAWKYLISFDTAPDGSAKGAILAMPYNGKGPGYERQFNLESGEAKIFFASFDKKIDGFWGSTTGCTDGTSFQFERWNDKQVKGGVGNAACQLHYAELMNLVAEVLVVKLCDAPFDWRSWFWTKRQLMLDGKGS
ncbi:MAG: hypothetical protein AB7U34_08090 [Novosphingobium sp.]